MDRKVDNLDELTKIMKIISHEARLKILYYLIKEKKACVDKIAKKAKISQSQTSQFLSKMKDCGVVDFHKEKRTCFYFIKNKKVEKLMTQLAKIF